VSAGGLVAALAGLAPLRDLSVIEPDIEDVIARLYAGQVGGADDMSGQVGGADDMSGQVGASADGTSGQAGIPGQAGPSVAHQVRRGGAFPRP
jgi:hypothetical protein